MNVINWEILSIMSSYRLILEMMWTMHIDLLPFPFFLICRFILIWFIFRNNNSYKFGNVISLHNIFSNRSKLLKDGSSSFNIQIKPAPISTLSPETQFILYSRKKYINQVSSVTSDGWLAMGHVRVLTYNELSSGPQRWQNLRRLQVLLWDCENDRV